ncbi:MAG: LysM peptidoglycan-binding domain-containing protein [Chloroflexi bacterium]|nr:LysM peptidoglycan-binding domain-containing protein [Chloroflexota bacterium]
MKWKPIASLWCAIGLCLCVLSACYVGEERVIYITATPMVYALSNETTPTSATRLLSPSPTQVPQATLNPTEMATAEPSEYSVQAGDTLSVIALRYHTTVAALMQLNQISNPNVLYIGQILKLPGIPKQFTPAVKTLPNGALVRGSYSGHFDLAAFIDQLPGYVKEYYESWEYGAAAGGLITETRSAAEIIQSVSLEFSIDVRILLVLLEYLGNWLSDPFPKASRLSQPIAVGYGYSNGLYRQLSWAADQLNYGYYGWRFGSINTIQSVTGERFGIARGLNAASVALQTLFSQLHPPATWLVDVSSEGFSRVYREYFGDPFAEATDLNPIGHLKQPEFTLPFAAGETWYYTGGPHNGWGRNSTWSAVDFAPPDAGQHYSSCFVSSFAVRAVHPGMVVWSDSGLVLLDLDQDGDPGTGWLILYMHLSAEGRAKAGVSLATGEVVGYPSCEGGYSNATHLHIARRYNGEWMPADCPTCPEIPPFNLGGWQIEMEQYREYEGRMVRGSEERVAEQGRGNPINQISW